MIGMLIFIWILLAAAAAGYIAGYIRGYEVGKQERWK